jgi:phage-related baseplate assembly protein
MATAPEFVPRDVSAILAETIADYEARVGRTLQPAQVETLILQTLAYREFLIRNQIQSAAEQNLVEFSTAPVLDFLGELVGVTRLAATPATVDLIFVMVAGHGGVTIPAGTRVSSTDGLAVFATTVAKVVSAGVNLVQVPSRCTVAGTVGNGYTQHRITNILDPLAFVSNAYNLLTTGGGAEQETDAALRERIRLAPASFSVAGPYNAYKYFARTASASIVDVAVTNPTPGVVQVFPLMDDGNATPTQILNAVYAICNDERTRPLCSTLVVTSPTRLDYSLNVELTLYDTADQLATKTAVETALQAFVDERRKLLGQDVILSQLIRAAQLDGVYSVDFVGFTNIIVSPTTYPYCTNITVSIAGTTTG